MGIEYYAFALFITGLVCLVAIICKVLFSGVRRHRKLLDEKETKLLRLYQSVEEVIEEFNSQVEEAKEEIRQLQQNVQERETPQMRLSALPPIHMKTESPYEKKRVDGSRRSELPRPYEEMRRFESSEMRTEFPAFTPAAPPRNEPQFEAITRSEPPPENERRIRSGETGRQESVPAFQRMIDELIDDSSAPYRESGVKIGKNEAILRLKNEGRNVTQIARELGITQNEVKLIIGLNQ